MLARTERLKHCWMISMAFKPVASGALDMALQVQTGKAATHKNCLRVQPEGNLSGFPTSSKPVCGGSYPEFPDN
jgi:hypothetical protein